MTKNNNLEVARYIGITDQSETIVIGMMETNVSLFIWGSMVIFVAALHLYTNASQVSLPILANAAQIRTAALINLIAAVAPFFVYLYTGESWTGLKLNPADEVRIGGGGYNPGHGKGMIFLVVALVWQMWTYKQHQSLHNATGYATFALLAYCLMEISGNAVFTFLPEKPELLARAYQDDVVGTWIVVKYSNAFFMGFMIPICIGAHGWFAYRNIQYDSDGRVGEKSKYRSDHIRLHVHHAASASVLVLGPGWLRVILRFLVFPGSSCTPFQDSVDVIRAQHTSLLLTSVLLLFQLECLHMGLPVRMRENRRVKLCRIMWFCIVQHTIISSAVLGVDAWPNCKYGGGGGAKN